MTNNIKDEKPYWLQDSVEEMTIFSMDNTDDVSNNQDFGKFHFRLEDQLQDKILHVAKSEHAIFILMLTALSCILYSFTKNMDFVLYVPSTDSHNMKIFPIRIRINESESFKDLIFKLKTEVEKAYRCKDDYLMQIQSKFNINLSNPIIISLKGVHNKVKIDYNNQLFEFHVSEGIDCNITYNTSINRKAIEILCKKQEQCLTGFLNQPNILINELDESLQSTDDEIEIINDLIKINTYKSKEHFLYDKIYEILKMNDNKMDEGFYERITEELLPYVGNSLDLAVILTKISSLNDKDMHIERDVENAILD